MFVMMWHIFKQSLILLRVIHPVFLLLDLIYCISSIVTEKDYITETCI